MKHHYATGLLTAILIILLGWGGVALADNCGGATSCDCGDTVTTDRTLDPGVDPICNPPACPGVGLFVESGVTLNLDGCTIRGRGVAQGLRIVFGATNVTLIGGTITGFAQGVASRVDGAADVTISRMTVHSNDLGIVLSGDGHTIELTTARNNDAGIVLTGDGNTLTTSKVSRNKGAGVTFTGNDGFVTRSRIELNVGAGVLLKGNGNEIARNYLQYNESDGLDLEGDENFVSLNRIYANGRRPPRSNPINPEADGVQLRPSSNLNTLSRNAINFNAGFGINDDSGHTDNTFTRNSCKSNGKGPSDPAGRC